VADGSVFVTSGVHNPTNTIMAVALRNMRHLAGSTPQPGLQVPLVIEPDPDEPDFASVLVDATIAGATLDRAFRRGLTDLG
jgi:hypothetical protein